MMQSKRFRALAMVGALTLAVCTGTTAMAEEASPMGNSPGDSEDIPDVRREWMCHLFLLNSH